MKDFLQYLFSSGWIFFGFLLIVVVVGQTIIYIILAIGRAVYDSKLPNRKKDQS